MKQFWQRIAEKVDNASLRERGMIFAAAALVLIALLDVTLIEPQFTEQRRLSLEVAQRQADIKTMQEQLKALAVVRQGDPDREIRRRYDALKKQAAEVQAKLAEEQRKFAPPEQVGALLGEMLSRNRKLQLVDMRSLPVATLNGNGADAGKPAGQNPAGAATPVGTGADAKIYRHGVEITVTGAYLDLLAYLKDLEKLPNQMYWGKLDLSVAAYPMVTLKLSVYTLSLDPAWLVV
jgi:MSHA biogenesis protein MshJ